jgi:hypothetical protein
MKNKHISFSKISDLYDENILSRTEREGLRDHLAQCEECRREYANLDRMLKMLHGMSSLGIKDESDFIVNTIEVIKQRRAAKKKGSVIRYSSLSAVAATIIVVVTLIVYNFSPKLQKGQVVEGPERMKSDFRDDSTVSKNNYEVLRTNFDIGKVLFILDKNNTVISDISDSYVVGETGLSNYRRLKRELDTKILGKSFRSAPRNVLETGKFDNEILREDWPYLTEGGQTVKFRVNLK